MRYYLLLTLFFSLALFAKNDTLVIQNSDRTKSIKIPLNYESKNITQAKLIGSRADYTFKLPIASRWVILSAKLKLHYTPSLAIIPERSTLAVSFNDKTVEQKWINATNRGIDTTLEVSLPAEKFGNFNQITINGYQHYTIDHCEDETAPELWTKIDTDKSYIELTVLPKILPATLSSIDHFLLDAKNITRQQIAFVLPPKLNKAIASSAVITASTIGKKLKYRDIDLTVTPLISSTSDSIVIASHSELLTLFKRSFPSNHEAITAQIRKQSILFFANPQNPQYGIICITGENDDALVNNAQAFASYNFNLHKGYALTVKAMSLPEKSAPYTAPNYLPTGQKITFRELGQRTTSFKYMYPAPMDLYFKMYPDLYFDDKQKISININGIYPTKVRHDSVLNILINDKFASQLPFDQKTTKEISVAKFFNYKKSDTFPAYLIGKGKNKLSLQPAMVPFKKGFCELYNMENLQTTLLDDSYIEIPDAPHWIEMPYIRYFLYGAYPFSIHPDGLKTALLMDSFSSSNLKAALKIGFFLGKEIEYPLYRVTVTTSVEDVEDKEIIYIGSYEHSDNTLFENAQVKIVGQNFSTSFPSIYKYIDYLPFFDTDRLEQFRYQKLLNASSNVDKSVLLQVFKSPYDKRHSVIALQYDAPESIEKAIDLLFSAEQEIDWNSDTLIINTELDKISSFEISNKYFLGTLSLFDQIRFYITLNPFIFGAMSLLLILIMAYVVRRLIQHFKERHHPHV